MRHAALPALAILAIGCNPPEAKDRQATALTLEIVEGSDPLVAVAAFAVNAGVDAQARDMATTIEIGMSTLYQEGVHQNIELTVFEGFLEEIATAGWSEGTVSTTITPGFSSCDGASYTIREDGGCDYTFGAFFVGDSAYGGVASFDLKTQAPDDWEGDPDSIEVFIEAELAEAKETP